MLVIIRAFTGFSARSLAAFSLHAMSAHAGKTLALMAIVFPSGRADTPATPVGDICDLRRFAAGHRHAENLGLIVDPRADKIKKTAVGRPAQICLGSLLRESELLRFPAVAATFHTFVTDLFFATSLRVTVNATHFPSGDIRGPLMRDSFCMSSTRNTRAANARRCENHQSKYTNRYLHFFSRLNLLSITRMPHPGRQPVRCKKRAKTYFNEIG